MERQRNLCSKYRKNIEKEGFINNFWYGFITPDETIIVLGHETGRRTINYAHCVMYFEQEKAAQPNPPQSFIFGIEGSPTQSYLLDKIFETDKNKNLAAFNQ